MLRINKIQKNFGGLTAVNNVSLSPTFPGKVIIGRPEWGPLKSEHTIDIPGINCPCKCTIADCKPFSSRKWDVIPPLLII